MIISRTPLRISFAGGGSDLPVYYQSESGAVVSTTINKYIYITVNPKFDHKIRASYSKTEIVERIEDLQHELIRESLKHVPIKGGIEITSISDIPSGGTGLGSSSSYTVGLLNALYAYLGQHAGAERLARESTLIEIQRCKRVMGKQDQYAAAYGGLRFYQFNPDESVFSDPIICKPETRQNLNRRLLMLYTGVTRSAPDILVNQTDNLLGSTKKRNQMRKMVQLAFELRKALQEDNLDLFGEILHEGWMYKRSLSKDISSPMIDDWYARARAAGALGGKVLGAGGGGFLLLFANENQHESILRALPNLRPVDIRFESQGSKIIFLEESPLDKAPPWGFEKLHVPDKRKS